MSAHWRIRKDWFCVAGLVGALAATSIAYAAENETAPGNPVQIKQAFLIQNSGWMEPFYTDANAGYRPLLNAFIEASQLTGVDIVVASFNQEGQLPGRQSPETLYTGPYDKAEINNVIAELNVPLRPNGRYPDSDFHGALLGAISNALDGGEGIIWMVTNNKNSPNNSQDVIANTGQFYEMLRSSSFITRIIAFPVRMVVTGPNYNERGFIIYGIAYGEIAAQALGVLLQDGTPLRNLFTNPPVRLKPLDQDPLALRLTAGSASEGNVRLEGRTIVIDGLSGESGLVFELNGELVNSYYPQEIVEAELSAALISLNAQNTPGRAAQISPRLIEGLGSGDALPGVSIQLPIPAVARDNIFQSSAVAVTALEVRLSNARLDLDGDFVSEMDDIFGIDLLVDEQGTMAVAGAPTVFFDYQRVNTAATIVPIRLIYAFSAWPMILALSGGAALLLLAAGGGALLLRAREHRVRVGGSSVRVRLRPFESRTVQGGDGTRAQVRGALFGAAGIRTLKGDDAAGNS